jgi:hypothetical protein
LPCSGDFLHWSAKSIPPPPSKKDGVAKNGDADLDSADKKLPEPDFGQNRISVRS